MNFALRTLRLWGMFGACALAAPLGHAWTVSDASLRNLSVLTLDIGFGTPTLTWQEGSVGTTAEVTVYRPPAEPLHASAGTSDWTTTFSIIRPDPPPRDQSTSTSAFGNIFSAGTILLEAAGLSSPLCCAPTSGLTYGQSEVRRFGDFTITGRGVVVFKMDYVASVWNADDVGDKDSRASVLMTASYADAGGASSGTADAIVFSSGAMDIAAKGGTLIVTITSNTGGGSGSFAVEALAYAASPVTAVPEPAACAMLLAGLGVLGLRIRRRRAT